MSIHIKNNIGAQMVLGSLRKNETELGKRLKKVASGMKVTGASDDPSGYAVSERMRVRVRALEQNKRNVQNGASFLKVAEGGIKTQIEILRTIKEKVIDAANDTNTDEDRKTIQGEIDQLYDQMEDIAQSTNFNGIYMLRGGNAIERYIHSWRVLDHAVHDPASSLDIIPDIHQTVIDGEDWWFDTFSGYNANQASPIKALGMTSAYKSYSGAQSVVARANYEINDATMGMTFAQFKQGIAAGETYGVDVAFDYEKVDFDVWFTNTANAKNTYASEKNGHVVDASAFTSWADVAKAIAGASGGRVGYGFSSTGDKANITLNAYYNNTHPDRLSVSGIASAGSSVDTRWEINAGSIGCGTVYFGGGLDEKPKEDNDGQYVPGAKASLTVSLPASLKNTGFIYYSPSNTEWKFAFVDGAAAPSYDGTKKVVTVGADWIGTSNVIGGITFERKADNTMTITANVEGEAYNKARIDGSGFKLSGGAGPTSAYKSLGTLGKWTQASSSDNQTTTASCDFDLSQWDTSDPDKLEDFIADLHGKALQYYNVWNPTLNDVTMVRFLDSAASLPYLYEYPSGTTTTTIDLNKLRAMTAGGMTIAEAFSNLAKSAIGSYCEYMKDPNDASKTIGFKIKYPSPGTAGNSRSVMAKTMMEPRDYYIEFAPYFERDDVKKAIAEKGSLAAYLDGKGFRVYCGTCADQWFNFVFYDPSTTDPDKPASGTDTLDIKSILIDISGVTDASSLVHAIVDQANPILEGPDPNYNHHLSLLDTYADDYGALGLYDRRLYEFSKDAYPNLSPYGVTIGDGILDNVIKEERAVWENRYVIQDTDKSSLYTVLHVPRTTLCDVFGFSPDGGGQYTSIRDFNVYTKEMRDALLGYDALEGDIRTVEKGILDTGIDYLTDAACIVGAQITRMEYDEQNITASHENVTASESVLRDADMAREMMEYTKANILAECSNAMLAQANAGLQNALALLG